MVTENLELTAATGKNIIKNCPKRLKFGIKQSLHPKIKLQTRYKDYLKFETFIKNLKSSV